MISNIFYIFLGLCQQECAANDSLRNEYIADSISHFWQSPLSLESNKIENASTVTSSSSTNNHYLYLQTYPNPVSSSLNIQVYGLYSLASGEGSLYIVNVIGQRLLDLTPGYRKHSNGKWSFFSSDISTLREGVYILIFESLTGSTSRRFLVMR